MKKLLFLLMLLCLLFAAHALADVYVEETPPEDWAQRELLRLTVFRTGEGDCMLLEAGGECMMIDGGPYKYREKLQNALTAREITHFKYLFNTHPHDDHINGLRALMSFGFTADEFVSVFPKNQHDTEENQKKAMAVLDKAGIPYRQLSSGDMLTLGGASVAVFHWPQGRTINAQSAIARVEFGQCSALLCADIIGDTQQYFLGGGLDAALLKADVVKAPHHGLTPMVSAFLDAVDPAYIFVTNYYDTSRIGKTEAQALRRGLPIQFSGAGTIILECDGTDWYIHQTLRQF